MSDSNRFRVDILASTVLDWTTMDNEKLLTAEQAARVTGLSPATLRKLAWQRRIRSFKVLGALRFKRSDLEELIVERPAIGQKGNQK